MLRIVQAWASSGGGSSNSSSRKRNTASSASQILPVLQREGSVSGSKPQSPPAAGAAGTSSFKAANSFSRAAAGGLDLGMAVADQQYIQQQQQQQQQQQGRATVQQGVQVLPVLTTGSELAGTPSSSADRQLQLQLQLQQQQLRQQQQGTEEEELDGPEQLAEVNEAACLAVGFSQFPLAGQR
jgi:hypothetical protein